MDRRKFLKKAMILPAFSFGGLSVWSNETSNIPFAAPFKRVRPGDPGWPSAASYVSESNFFEPGWQQSFWGSNYSKLAAVKKKYDPQGLFFVHHGVGSETWSDDGFTRLTE